MNAKNFAEPRRRAVRRIDRDRAAAPFCPGAIDPTGSAFGCRRCRVELGANIDGDAARSLSLTRRWGRGAAVPLDGPAQARRQKEIQRHVHTHYRDAQACLASVKQQLHHLVLLVDRIMPRLIEYGGMDSQDFSIEIASMKFPLDLLQREVR
jgi:hypothetical protein